MCSFQREAARDRRPARPADEPDQATLREALLSEDLDRVRGVVEPLSDEFDLVEVALAAIKLAHEAGGFGEDEEEIPEAALRSTADRGRGGVVTTPGRRRFSTGSPTGGGQ